MKSTVMYRAMVLWNALPGHIIQENNKYRFKELLKEHLLAKQLSVSLFCFFRVCVCAV